MYCGYCSRLSEESGVTTAVVVYCMDLSTKIVSIHNIIR